MTRWQRGRLLRLLIASLSVAAVVACVPGVALAAGPAPAFFSGDLEPGGSWSAVGQIVYADPGVWVGSPTLTAQWFRCDSSVANCSAIGGATSFAYTLVSADLGHTVFADVTGTNGSGSWSNSTFATGVVGAPTKLTDPVITGDIGAAGNTLTVSNGTWTGSPTAFGYQWSRCSTTTFACTAINGATSSTYQLANADVGMYMTADVTATNALGSADNGNTPAFSLGTATSNVVGPHTAPAAPQINPSWHGDSSSIGDTLTGNAGVWSNDATGFSVGWERCDSQGNNCAAIDNIVGPAYTLTPTDLGHVIIFDSEGIGPFGSTGFAFGGGDGIGDNDVSYFPGPAGAPVPTVTPTLTGDATGVGSTLGVSNGIWNGSPTGFAYQWYRCTSDSNCSQISGATGASYTLVNADLGFQLFASVTATNAYGSTVTSSSDLSWVIGSPVAVSVPVIDGDTSTVGSTLTATGGNWINNPTAFTYQWYRCQALCSPIAGADISNYVTQSADIGYQLELDISGQNALASWDQQSAETATIGVATGRPALTSYNAFVQSTTMSDTFPVDELGDVLSASPMTWTGSPTLTYQWERCTQPGWTSCVNIAGATGSSHAVVSADLGNQLQLVVTATNGSGATRTIQDGFTAGAPQALTVDGGLTGTAQVGNVLTMTNNGTWAGDTPITFVYTWYRCDSNGDNCVIIPGATANTYTLVSADQGHQIEATVFGTNVWGTGFGFGDISATVSAAAGGGGGGGGGGGSIPDLAMSVSGPAQVAQGGQATFSLAVSDLDGAGASNVHAIITLPAGATVDSATADRGPGCAAGATAGTLDCNLDFLSGSLVAHVTIVLTLPTAGPATLTATVSDAQGDKNTANNTASATVQVGSTPTTPTSPTPTPTPTPKAPPLHDINGNAKANHLTGTSKADLIKAGAGNDWVNGGAGNDVIYGGTGKDTLYGGAGNDRIYGGPGADEIFGGAGNDTIYAVDGVKDTIDCGSGHDIVYADKHDKVAKDCEVVHRT